MHFYTSKNGEVQPRHFVPMTKDPSRSRPSRISDAKKAARSGEIWYPSVTTILNVLDKPALINWKIDQHLYQAYEINHLPEDVNDYISEVKRLTSFEMDKAPSAGTDIHEVLEFSLFNPLNFSGLSDMKKKIVLNVEAALLEMGIKPEDIEREKYFINKEYGYAGCADLTTKHLVIDYKSKQTKEKFKPGKMAYPEHCRQ